MSVLYGTMKSKFFLFRILRKKENNEFKKFPEPVKFGVARLTEL